MEEKIQSAAELLRAYFRDMPSDQIQSDWDSVKDLKFDGPTIEEFLSSFQSYGTEDIKYDDKAFQWKQLLKNDMENEVGVAYPVNQEQLEIQDGQPLSTSDKSFSAGHTQYALAA